MEMLPRADEVSLTTAAMKLRMSYHAARTLMLQGELRGRQVGRFWYVLAEDVDRVAAARGAPVAAMA